MESNGIGLPSVLLDGALGREFGSDQAFHSHPFSPEIACEVLAVLEKRGVSPCINVDTPGRDVVLGDRPSVRAEHLRALESSAREEDRWTAVRNLRVLAFTVLSGDPTSMRQLAVEVAAQAPVTAAIASDRTYGGVHLSFVSLGVSKWDGALGFCAARGIDPARVLAIGDADNDLELLENAAVALVVADGSPAALERADRVVAPASEGGWAEILDLLSLTGD
jgi:hydroxymethylpyrimidine pyrophosphatase-like HAD family hydrolase